MKPDEWLRAIAVWSPAPEFGWGLTLEERIAIGADFLAADFPPEAFCAETARLVASQCETFPNFYQLYKVLEGRP